MRVIGLDPGLRKTGWGVIEAEENRLRHVANGIIVPNPSMSLAERLARIHTELTRIIEIQDPEEAAVEVTLANKNAASTLKLGMARGVALLTPALADLPVTEYQPLVVKKAVVGTGRAEKRQVAMMIARLLPGCPIAGPDAADALAVAVCHAHSVASRRRWAAAVVEPRRPELGGGTR